MVNRNQKEKGAATTWQKPNPSYAYKPFAIGAVIKTVTKEKNITPVELERRMGFTHRNIYRLFKSRSQNMAMLLKASEALGENLLLHYHPNVPPLPNPLQAENKRLQKELEGLKQRLNELTPLVDEVKVLKGQLDILRDVMKGR
ncbi:MAG: hypothetical protein V4615_10995 [Bacteroidota bacterium]